MKIIFIGKLKENKFKQFIFQYTPQEVCYEIGLCDPPTNEIEVEHIETNVIPRNFEIEEEQTDLQ